MDPQQPQQPQQPIMPPQPPVQGPEPAYTQTQYQPQPASVPQSAYQQQTTPPVTPSPVSPVQPVQQPYQAQPYEPQPAPGQFGPAGAVPPQPGFPQQPQPQNGVFGSGPAASYTPGPSKGKGKLFTLIGVIAAGLIVLGVGVWALMTFVFASIPLETYKGDGYSILVPKDYKKDESSTGVTFESEKKKGKDGTDVYSILYIGSTDVSEAMTKDQMIDAYDKYFNEDALKQSASLTASSSDGKFEIKNFKTDKSNYQGFTARKYTAETYRDNTKVGDIRVLAVFTDKKVYSVSIGAHAQVEPGFRASADKILNSFKIEE